MRNTDKVTRLARRTDRMLKIDNRWYFKTREGDFMGPYATLIDANLGIDVYRALLRIDVDQVA